MGGFLSGALDEAPKVEREVDCGGGFKVQINWLSPAQQDEVHDAAYNWKKRKPAERDAIAKKWCKLVVKGWSGLTPTVFYNRLRLYVLKEHQAKIADAFKSNGGEFPYSPEDAIYVYLNANPDHFHTPIREALTEMSEEDRTDIALEDSKSA